MFLRSIALLCLLVATHAQAFQRADMNRVIPNSRSEFNGLREMKPVLDGVLYRGGGPGGKVALNEGILTALCEAGFTDAGYLYPDNFRGRQTLNCAGRGGNITYDRYGFLGARGAETFLRKIHELIKNGGKMFVHCWNGWHASGEVAAYALVQFCDFTPQEAAQYWQENVGDGARISRIGKFTKIPGLDITGSEKARICPR